MNKSNYLIIKPATLAGVGIYRLIASGKEVNVWKVKTMIGKVFLDKTKERKRLMTVNLKINHCGECPNMNTERYYTADSWENVSEWRCSSNKNKRIALQEWNDSAPPIPEWCPLREST